MNPFEIALPKLLDIVDALPEGSLTRRDVEKAAREAKAESFLDANGRVTGHPFVPRKGTSIDRSFCADCTWHADKHGDIRLCGMCRHAEEDHRRSPGGKLRICRRRIQRGSHDVVLCGCRAFRE